MNDFINILLLLHKLRLLGFKLLPTNEIAHLIQKLKIIRS